MRKIIVLIAIFSLTTKFTFSQEKYMDSIVEKACECVSEIPEGEPLTSDNFGICILAEASKYGDELLRDYNINMLNIDMEGGEELGRIVALKMMSYCPVQIKRIASTNQNEEEIQEEETLEIITGKVKSIEVNDVVSFSIKASNGRTSKFYWLTFVNSDFDFQEKFNELKGKGVQIEYSIVELYDPKLKEYRNYNLIETLNLLK